MSKLYENDYGFFISHEEFINGLYINTEKPLKIKPSLFNIKEPYKSHKHNKNKVHNCNGYEVLREERENVKLKFYSFMSDFSQKYKFEYNETEIEDVLGTAESVYNITGKVLVKDASGANMGPATIRTIGDSNFCFPQNSVFFSKDIIDIKRYLKNEQYDLILLDPPWWNKYIRRKRKKTGNAYEMLFNTDIKNLPIESLLKDNGMVIVWCTNSQQHINDLFNEIFPKWKVTFVGKWYWIKVTLSGKPICTFSLPPGKLPYEQIIFACRGNMCSIPFNSKLVVSVPSAIHSHKPPLMELVKHFLPDNPSCLEVFARYLLPNWTSYGNEVLRLQHESLFVAV